MERHDAARQPAAVARLDRLGSAAARRGGVPAGQRASSSAGSCIHGTQCGLRPTVDTLPCLRNARSRRRRARRRRSPSGCAGRSRGPTTPSSTRPIATARRWAASSSSTRASSSTIPTARRSWPRSAGTVVYAGRAEAGRAHRRHPARHHRHRRREALPALFDLLPQLLAGREGGRRGATGQVISRVGNTGRATNDHLHLELCSVAHRFDRRDRGLAAAISAVHHQPRALARAAAGHGHRRRAGVRRVAAPPVPQARIYGIVQARPERDPVLLRRDLRRQGALPPALRRALRGERRAGRHLRRRHRRSTGRRSSAQVTVEAGQADAGWCSSPDVHRAHRPSAVPRRSRRTVPRAASRSRRGPLGADRTSWDVRCATACSGWRTASSTSGGAPTASGRRRAHGRGASRRSRDCSGPGRLSGAGRRPGGAGGRSRRSCPGVAPRGGESARRRARTADGVSVVRGAMASAQVALDARCGAGRAVRRRSALGARSGAGGAAGAANRGRGSRIRLRRPIELMASAGGVWVATPGGDAAAQLVWARRTAPRSPSGGAPPRCAAGP